jgi:ATP-binding cassette subfamily B protein
VLEFFPLLALVVILALLGAVLRTWSRRVLFDVGRTIERDARQKLFFHLSTLDDAFFRKHPVGDLMNHLSTDMSNIRMVAGFASLNIMNIVFVFIFTVPLLIKIDMLLALCALAPFPLIILSTRGIAKKMFQATIDYQAQLSTLTSHVQENLLGAHVVRIFHQQRQENERFAKTNQEVYVAGVKLARVRVMMQPIMRLTTGLAVGLVLYAGGLAVVSGRISVGDFVEVNARILQLAWPAMSVGFVMSVLSRGRASLSRINYLLSSLPSITDGFHEAHDIRRITVNNSTLKKDGVGPEHQLNFQISRGHMLGVVGPSGSYKSTLLRALSRRLIVPRQTIFFDNQDINQISLNSIYANIAIVPEESFLFHKSIKENICFTNPHASKSAIDEVLALTRLDNDLASFTDGIDTIVGDRGIMLSGGQRQRVALARALIARRPIIIIDDALSSVDGDTERHIVSQLRDYLADSIVIIATHRLSAVKDADHIIVLDGGRMIASGVHRELLESSPLYQQLWGLDQLQGHWE